ncbi:uncharacterized protein [Diadema setosum]|uniref:uncharacterized protein n=1 Tax=Diadema setosum TaxID=31175 RepID=UPI003B3AC892
MPYESPLYDFLDELDLQQYHQEFVNKLGVTALDHLTYVQQDDVSQLGMTQPEWRRLRASMKKVKKAKKGGKTGSKPPPPLSKVTTQGPGAQPSGGHIIPATDIKILDKELGRGEFGKVMQGLWCNREGQQIPVAVKCLSPDKLSLDKCQQDFLKEAAIMHSLNHDHLVKLYGVVLDVESSLMLVTEFAPLRSLAENIKQEALKPAFPIPLLLDYSVQIAEAMRYLHMSNIIHRDLAARNILMFVDNEGNKTAKISDFGLSRRLLLGENYRSEMRPNLKLPLAWMPVESLTKLTFTKASDVWSFGVTLWEMFSYGRQPWTTLSGEEILKTIDKPRCERLSRPEACPPGIYELMIRCWAHEPENRMSFAELCEELPKMKPMQVKTLSSHTGLHPEELSYRADDIIAVVEANEDTGVWKGINPMGKIGYFQRADTVALGNAQMGKLKRWRSGRSSKTENRRSILYASQRPKRQSKLTLEDISKPKDYKHIFHVGVDGKVEGDPTFGGDYRNIPKSESDSPSRSSSGRSDSKSSSPSKSPAKPKKNNNKKSPTIELSKETILPPPNGFDSGSTVSVPDVVPSVTSHESTAPPTQETSHKAQFAVLAEPEVTYTNGTSSETFSSHNGEAKHESPTTTDDLSAFEMGSLLDDMMSVWDSAKLNLDFNDGLESTPEEHEEEEEMAEEDSQTLLEGEEIGRSNGDASLSRSTNRVGEENPVAFEAEDAPGRDTHEMEGDQGGGDGGVARNEVEEELGAVGGASANGASHGSGKGTEGSLLSGNIIIKDSISKPTKTYRKVPRQTAPGASGEGEAPNGASKPEPQPQEQSAPRTRPGREVNLMRQLSREKRWDNEFKRLSSSPKDKADNDYIDTNSLQQGKGKSSSEEYEELALASSPQPYTLRDNVLDSANVMRVPRSDVSRSVSLRTSRPTVDSYSGRTETELNRSQSLREPPISPLGQQAYDSLVGGDISSNSRRGQPVNYERRAPAVPPKPAPKPPARVKTPEGPTPPVRSGEGRFRNGEARVSGLANYRSYSGTSSDDGMSEDGTHAGDASNTRGAVASLRQRFNSNPSDGSPPKVPPREPDLVLSQRSSEYTKVSKYTGVRLRTQYTTASEQANGNGSFYAEHENNNAYTDVTKLSSTTLQNLEQHMPRRTRRSIGEDRIKRRNSSDASDSESEATPKGRTERVWSTSSRASEGDSSSDETFASTRASSSSSERISMESRSSGYKSPPRSLYDLPEDQTNSNSNRTTPAPDLHSHHQAEMEHSPPPLPPRVADSRATLYQRPLNNRLASEIRDVHGTRPPDGVERGKESPPNVQSNSTAGVVPPPRPQRCDLYDRLPRSRTIDIPVGEHYVDSRNHSSYDVLPVRRPAAKSIKSFSVDAVDMNDDYMISSAAGIRQLLKERPLSGSNDNNESFDDDNLDDMPDTSPPPVPTPRQSYVDSTYSVVPSGKHFLNPQESTHTSKRGGLIREPEYVLMKPQTDRDFKREYDRFSNESDYAVPIAAVPRVYPVPAARQSSSPDSRQRSGKDQAIYELMKPQQSDAAPYSFVRTNSAHFPSRPSHLAPSKAELRRGTVASSIDVKSRERDGSSSLPRRDQSWRSGSQSEAQRIRRSRSFDDLLQDDRDIALPQEAESLQDLLARAHLSAVDRPAHSTIGDYMVPPSARRQVALPPPPDSHHFSQHGHAPPPPLPSSKPPTTPPPSGSSHGEAAYLDMSQASLERRKKKKGATPSQPKSSPSSQWEPVQSGLEQYDRVPSLASRSRLVQSASNQSHPAPPTSEPQATQRLMFYGPNDDEVDL